MSFLDLRTVLINYICGNLVCAVVLFALWKENRFRYTGLGYWTISFGLNVFGMALLTGRGVLPDFFSMLLGSLFLVGGTFMLYAGIRLFLEKPGIPIHLYLILALYVFFQTYFIYIRPNLEIRNILFSIVLVIFSIQFAWLLFFQLTPEQKKITHALGVITSLFGVVAIIRIFINFLIPPGNDVMKSPGYESLLYLSFQLLYLILTIVLFMMVNRRLQFDLQADIAEREKAEEARLLTQEKYAKAFLASPNAILISRIEDGKILEINDGFTQVSGYTREESLNNSTISLGFWKNPADRAELIKEMKTQKRVRNYVFAARNKNGKVILVEISSEYIRLNDEDCMLSVIQDISERKRIEDILKLRLKLWDYSISHTPIEVMQKALDEIEILTESQISFYHLVEENSNTLSLQAWSTRTQQDFCKAEGNGMHYSIDQAGVWVDCIRERKPIIHNDYASLPNKKGMPEGHAKVIREMLIPIFQENQIVSILGIGNKPTDYDNDDVELVSYIADLVWTIVSRKRSEEKIHQLNSRLELLAMTDELTKLSNRRHFFQRGNEEIGRSRRYKHPLSLIILDIDKFKLINDTHGHDIGDLALQFIARILKEQCREVDLAARLGGEEFGILLPDTKLTEAAILAERIRERIENSDCLTKDITVHMTASFGVATLEPEMKNLDSLFHNADTAMYQAKNSGRNKVMLFQDNQILN